MLGGLATLAENPIQPAAPYEGSQSSSVPLPRDLTPPPLTSGMRHAHGAQIHMPAHNMLTYIK